MVVTSFLVGIFVSYQLWAVPPSAAPRGGVEATAEVAKEGGKRLDLASLISEVRPELGYALPARYGDLGPRLIAGGAIDYAAFSALFANGGQPLDAHQIEILTSGSQDQIVITAQNARFLLDFFWAVGLANKNKILTEGAMATYADGKIEGFASTGGWTLSAVPVGDLYASLDLITLNLDQQQRLEKAAGAVYRPCCDNPTLFPDCNHGMAMLGLLELMAAGNASVEDMLRAAKYINAFWFPEQTLETAVYLTLVEGVDFREADPAMVTDARLSSGSGFARLHKSLQDAGLLPPAPGGGGNCGA